MTEGDDLAWGQAFHSRDKGRDVIGPLAPRVHVASLSLALAVSAKINRICGHAPLAHRLCERLVSPAVLAQTVNHRERVSGLGLGPSAIEQAGAVDRGDLAVGGDGLSGQDGRIPAGS